MRRYTRTTWQIASALRVKQSSLVTSLYRSQFSPDIHRRFPNSFAEEASPQIVQDRYFRPMIELLAIYATTGDRTYRDVYLSEWRRYAPHREGRDVLRQYFQEIVPAYIETLREHINGGKDVAEWLNELHSPLLTPSREEKFIILTIGDCLMSELQTFLLASGVETGVDYDFRYYYFSGLMNADIATDGIRKAIESGVDAIAASYLSYEGIPLYRALMEGADRASHDDMQVLVDGIVRFMCDHIMQMRALTDVPLLLHNACGLRLTRWRRLIPILPSLSAGRRRAIAMLNDAVASIVDNTENCILVDETSIVENQGLRQIERRVIPRRLERQADFHPSQLGQRLAQLYATILHDVRFLRKIKVVAVDFDNTIWDGVMADGPVIQYHERQGLLKRLATEGIVLVAVSKNDPRNIRWDEMTLTADDFAALKINWNLKSQSIRELASELNLGLEAFVLLDDNPAERALVEKALLKVRVLDATELSSWMLLERLFDLPNTQQTQEALERTRLYRAQAKRAETINMEQDYPSLMRTLALTAKVGPAKQTDLVRIGELFQRTNQFNTTTIRYTRGESESMLKDPGVDLLVGELSDRFGNLGLVGVVVVRRNDDSATIESFVMSCRAMGFGFEHLMLSEAVVRQENRRIVGKFIPTGRNEPCSNLYGGVGFKEQDDGIWVKPPEIMLQGPEWIAVAKR